ncbi:MAG: ATP-binding protein [Candidatus Thorarchaeota archaeon]
MSELYQNEKLFRELFENIKSGVAIYETEDKGENFIVTEMNKAGMEICKVTVKDLIGKNLIEVFPNIEKFGFIDALRKVWETGKPEHFPRALYQDDRVYGWTEMYIYRLPSKKVVTIFETQTKLVEAEQKRRKTEGELERLNKELEESIKERSKELKESEEKYRKLFENSPIAIMEQDYSEGKRYIDQLKSLGITDFEKYFDENPKEVAKLMIKGKIIDVNRKTLDLYKANTKEEFISRANHLSDDLGKNLTDEVLSYNKKEYLAFMKGETIYESEIASKTFTEDINYIYAKSAIMPGFEKNWAKVVVTLIDITKNKIAEQKLKESEEKYRKAYYQASLYRDIFTHDINNILQNITSSVELSSLYLDNPEKLHTIKELYEIVDEQVNRAKKLISNVRKITELDESEIGLENIEVNHLLKNAIEFVESSFQTRNINIKINSPMKKNYVYADNLLLDVFENILINAVRYNNRSNIEIVIDINIEQKGDKTYLKMQFKNNGVGISDYRKKSIFERGTRKYQESKGMGLGLSLVKKIMDNYQGQIWVEDRIKGDYKQGSNFIILIPSDN